MLFKVTDFVSSFIFPEIYCICCGNAIDENCKYGLCNHCIEHIHRCEQGIEHKQGCSVIRCCDYGLYERSIIFSLKYRGNKNVARHISKIMSDRIYGLGYEFDIAVPVPIHRSKMKTRGFNQAELIAKYFARLQGIRHYSQVLVRKRQTMPMRNLDARERAQNVAGSIELKPGYEGFARDKKIVLIDDFITTGSTARECVNALINAQAKSITVLTFAGRK